ncbi:hypothetical protein, partial [uncultured Roseobacter sp.]|uniref:hypothetical protein n=1 Tax=uncultured Roseobacter sp. TaxID=114847 RepID=UPI00260F342E
PDKAQDQGYIKISMTGYNFYPKNNGAQTPGTEPPADSAAQFNTTALIGLSSGTVLSDEAQALEDLAAQGVIAFDGEGGILFRPGNFSEDQRFDIFKAAIARDPGTADAPSGLLVRMGLSARDQARIDMLANGDGHLDMHDVTILEVQRDRDRELGGTFRFLDAPADTTPTVRQAQAGSPTTLLNFRQSADSGFDIRVGDPVPPLVPGSASPRIEGTVYEDLNGNQRFDGFDRPIPGAQVFKDENANGIYDTGEVAVQTDENGRYAFENNRAGGAYTLAAEDAGLIAQDVTHQRFEGQSGIPSAAVGFGDYADEARNNIYGLDLSSLKTTAPVEDGSGNITSQTGAMTGVGSTIFLLTDSKGIAADRYLEARGIESDVERALGEKENYGLQAAYALAAGAPDATIEVRDIGQASTGDGGTIESGEQFVGAKLDAVLEYAEAHPDEPLILLLDPIKRQSIWDRLFTDDTLREEIGKLDNLTVILPIVGKKRILEITGARLQTPNLITVTTHKAPGSFQVHGRRSNPTSFDPRGVSLVDPSGPKTITRKDINGNEIEGAKEEGISHQLVSGALVAAVVADMQQYARMTHGSLLRADEVASVLHRSGQFNLRTRRSRAATPGHYRTLDIPQAVTAMDTLVASRHMVVAETPPPPQEPADVVLGRDALRVDFMSQARREPQPEDPAGERVPTGGAVADELGTLLDDVITGAYGEDPQGEEHPSLDSFMFELVTLGVGLYANDAEISPHGAVAVLLGSAAAAWAAAPGLSARQANLTTDTSDVADVLSSPTVSFDEEARILAVDHEALTAEQKPFVREVIERAANLSQEEKSDLFDELGV